METPCRVLRGRMRLARGDTRGAHEDAERALELARVGEGSAGVVAGARVRSPRVLPTDPQRADDHVAEVLSEWEALG